MGQSKIYIHSYKISERKNKIKTKQAVYLITRSSTKLKHETFDSSNTRGSQLKKKKSCKSFSQS